MNAATPIVIAAVWMFLFRKAPSWGWFSRALGGLPSPVKGLWQGWTDCTYCGGFWIALLVRAALGMKFLTFPEGAQAYLEVPLDALSAGLGALLIILILDALKARAGSH
jgi:hypothetical protein